jgi:hypothetical protein
VRVGCLLKPAVVAAGLGARREAGLRFLQLRKEGVAVIPHIT